LALTLIIKNEILVIFITRLSFSAKQILYTTVAVPRHAVPGKIKLSGNVITPIIPAAALRVVFAYWE